ncbi:MAG: hypothetical protein RBS68_13600 [Anaerolineales bacterium]|jgi:hypothetical protein|nr:hypothetical protein [Anaerolineales bacterium]
MLPQLRNMDELVAYLGTLENRIQLLEQENKKLLAKPASKAVVEGKTIAKYVYRILPQSNIISPSFLKRAFTVWGHFFVANLIIGIIVGAAYMCLAMVLFGSIFGGLIQNSK